jgi:hypothetical protein
MNRLHTILRQFIPLLIVAGTALVLTSATAMGQGTVLVIDSVSVRTDDARDNSGGLPYLKFGFGTDYTDGPDTADGKGEFPFPFIGGPGGFAAAMAVVDFQGDPGYDYKDIRGVPDSVTKVNGANYFSLTYTIRIQPGIGNPVVTTSGALSRGIDSIVVQSTQPGANFRHLFLPDGGTVNVGRREITDLELIVYYNYNRAAAAPVAVREIDLPTLALYPNPVGSNGLLQSSYTVPAGARLVMSDLLGETVITSDISEQGTLRVAVPNLHSGLYLVRLLSADGSLLRRGSVVIDR